MFRLQFLQSDEWALLNEQDDEVFRGKLSDCETWLDAEENRTSAAKHRNLFSDFKLRDWIHRIWAGPPIAPLHCTPTSNPPAGR